MSKFKSGWFHRIFSFNKSKGEGLGKEDEFKQVDINELISCDLEEDTVRRNRRWGKDYKPRRQILLWGWDDQKNPSFLILYGIQQFKQSLMQGTNILEKDVQYRSYAIFSGRNGHLPSIPAVKIIEQYDYRNRCWTNPRMYYKKGLKHRWSWRASEEDLVKSYCDLPEDNYIVFDFYKPWQHSDYVKEIKAKNITFPGFRLADSPRELIGLEGEYEEVYSLLIDSMSHPNIYMRKKCLCDLLNKDLPKEFFVRLLERASAEFISGLFLELAKRKQDFLQEEAKAILAEDINWVEENYAEGVRRTAKIYLTAIDDDLRAKRIQWIRNNLYKMDLHLTKVKDKPLPKDKILKGSAYRKYAYSGLMMDYYYQYDYSARKSTIKDREQRYETSIYSDGVRLNIIEFKNTMQEAEIYGLADVIGKVAYFLDAPRITYYLKGSQKGKALRYFRRYIKRVINAYGETAPDKFMEAMKHMLSSYTEFDSICKYEDVFRYNELLTYYLYFDYYKDPEKYRRNLGYNYNFVSVDPLLNLKGRYEYKKEVWDEHLEVVVDIASTASIKQVLKACYYILKDSPRANELIHKLDYRQLILLAHSKYEPMAEMFMDILNERLNHSEAFDAELMIALIASPYEKLHNYAKDYFARTNGCFSPSDTADLLFLDNLQSWEEIFRSSLLSFEDSKFIEFVKELINRADKLLKFHRELPENIRDILALSASKVEGLSEDRRVYLIEMTLASLAQGVRMPQWMGDFIEEVIFSVPYESMDHILAKLEIEASKGWNHARNKRILSLLEAVKNKSIPEDLEIMDTLAVGGSKMVKRLVEVIERNINSLSDRLTTLLLMMESDVLVLNQMAEQIFQRLPLSQQGKLHAMIIDSPISKVYAYGLKQLDLVYGEKIPQQFIIQMLEHPASEVKAYVSDKMDRVLNNLEDEKLFMYYARTLLLMPNRFSKSKDKVYELIPQFALKYRSNLESIQQLLLELGASNSIKDSERALVTWAKIQQEVMVHEG